MGRERAVREKGKNDLSCAPSERGRIKEGKGRRESGSSRYVKNILINKKEEKGKSLSSEGF